MNACISFTSRFLLFAVFACDLPFGDTIKGSPKTPRTGFEVRLPVRAPARLRRERRWVRSSFGGEFNAALVAPYRSAE
jgi:hypothetical protein